MHTVEPSVTAVPEVGKHLAVRLRNKAPTVPGIQLFLDILNELIAFFPITSIPNWIGNAVYGPEFPGSLFLGGSESSSLESVEVLSQRRPFRPAVVGYEEEHCSLFGIPLRLRGPATPEVSDAQ